MTIQDLIDEIVFDIQSSKSIEELIDTMQTWAEVDLENTYNFLNQIQGVKK